MRLWHQDLLPYLSTKRLVRQHCECCGLNGNGWGRKHKTVQYVFNHSHFYLAMYHALVIQEMERRGYHVNEVWKNGLYRGKNCEPWSDKPDGEVCRHLVDVIRYKAHVYPEHNEAYLKECLEILDRKGEHIEWKN